MERNKGPFRHEQVKYLSIPCSSSFRYSYLGPQAQWEGSSPKFSPLSVVASSCPVVVYGKSTGASGTVVAGAPSVTGGGIGDDVGGSRC